MYFVGNYWSLFHYLWLFKANLMVEVGGTSHVTKEYLSFFQAKSYFRVQSQCSVLYEFMKF
jgi:hypothetical protein